MKKRWLLGSLISSAILVALVACGDDEPESDPAVCSNGPAQYSNENPPPTRAPSTTHRLPDCAPRCGQSRLPPGQIYGGYAYASLPSGACTGHARCSIGSSSTQTCGTDTHACALSGTECGCEDGQWRCYLVAPGAGVCTPCGSTDAGASD